MSALARRFPQVAWLQTFRHQPPRLSEQDQEPASRHLGAGFCFESPHPGLPVPPGRVLSWLHGSLSVFAPVNSRVGGTTHMPALVPPAVDVQGVMRRFGEKVALAQVSMQVARGEIHALLGPNGAGKTTLLRILSGLTEASSGTVQLMGRNVTGDALAIKRMIGMVPSGERSFYYRISGLENLIFFARLYGLAFKKAASRARQVIEQVDLTDAMGLPVGRYSHGMQGRLSVARALLADPPVLLIDEATHDLDPGSARRVQGLIRGAAGRGAAVVWATQNLDVNISGVGSVSYYGDPTVTQVISGLGSVQHLGDK